MEYKMVITKETLREYDEVYFAKYPRRRKRPIGNPYHESINEWMIMRRSAMNALKQRWKEFIEWFVAHQGYANLHIEKCEITQAVYYPTNRRHDIDNSVPKFILDGIVEAGMVVDDDCKHMTKLSLECFVDPENPRTELTVTVP